MNIGWNSLGSECPPFSLGYRVLAFMEFKIDGKEKSIYSNKDISIGAKKRFLKCYIWLILFHGYETCTISTYMKKKLEPIEMWF